LSDEQRFWMETLKANRKRRVRVVVPVSVPACGYTTLYVQPGAQAPVEAADWQVQDRYAENRYWTVYVEDDGGLLVTDKATGQVYHGLNHFEDVADAGDSYTFCPLHDDAPITTRGKMASIRRLWSGPNAACFEIVHQITLPVGLSPDRQARSGETPIAITATVTVQRDCPYIQVKTHFNNTAQDHKLSAIFPTDFQALVAQVDESFAVVERQIELPSSAGWVEDPTPLMHQRTFTDLSAGGAGLAILNRGLASVEVIRTEAGGAQIGLPLVRAVGWLSRDDLWVRRIAAGPLVPAPGAQCSGERVCEYAILPHAGDWRAVYPLAYAYTTPVIAARADTHAGIDLHDMNITRDDPAKITYIPFPRGGNLPDSHSFVQVAGEGIVLSAFRRGCHHFDGWVVRFYNITDQPTMARIRADRPLASAQCLNMNEEVEGALVLLDAHSLEIAVRAGQVVTVGLTPG
jgi:alpha-mannosidase